MSTRKLAVPERRAKGSARRSHLMRQLVNYSFVLPAGVFLLLFIAYPIFFNFRISFSRPQSYSTS